MSVTAFPVLPAGARRAPYIAANGDRVLPGCYGVSRGVGITGVLIAPVASHPDALWNARFPLTGAQRERICARALALVGRQYEYPAYTGFALKVLKPREDAELDPVFKADHWQVCSALVADCYAYAGIRLEPGLKD